MDSDTLYRLGLDGQTLQNMRELYPDEVFDTGSQMLEGRYCVEESAFSALLELDEGDYPFQGLPKCSAPVTVLFSHFSGSAVDTTADYANAWGLTTIGTHTAGATGNLMVVPLCTGYAVTFSGSRQIASDGTDIQNNGVQPRIEVPGLAGGVPDRTGCLSGACGRGAGADGLRSLDRITKQRPPASAAADGLFYKVSYFSSK